MSQLIINVGSSPDDGTGDTLRLSQQKTNDNFTELYTGRLESGGATDQYYVVHFGIAKNANYVGAGNWQTPDRNGSTIFNDTSSFGNYYNGTIVTDARVGKVKLPFNCQLVDGMFYLTHAGGTNGAEELRIIGFEVSGASVVGTTTMASATYTQGNSTSNGDLGSLSLSTFNKILKSNPKFHFIIRIKSEILPNFNDQL